MWIQEHHDLPLELEQRFLTKDGIVDELARLPDDAVTSAVAKYEKLADILAEAKSQAGRPRGARRPTFHPTAQSTPQRRRPATNNLREAFDGHRPQQPVDADLMKKFGPVQRYDDDF